MNGCRLCALIRKEFLQVLRDPSSIAIAILLPLLLLFIFGYGVSLDVENMPIALVIEQPNADTASFAGQLYGSRYFNVRPKSRLAEAEDAMLAGEVGGIVRLRSDFSRYLERGNQAPVQLIVNGVDANTARIITGYVTGAWLNWLAHRGLTTGTAPTSAVDVQQRVWYNAELRSRNFLAPGLIALILTLIGAMLTAMVMAREWERGTMEALLATPIRMQEALLGKLITYFILGMTGAALTTWLTVTIFQTPMRGSLWVLAACSSLFMLTALGMGLLISSFARQQFIAAQAALILTYLPAFLLSGFIFDIRSMPWVVRMITYAFPARYFVSLLQTIFMAGNIWPVILPNAAALAGMATLFLVLTRRLSQRRLA